MSSILTGLATGLYKLGEQAVQGAARAVDRLANKQEFDAVIAAAVLVAQADGSTSPDEKQVAVSKAATHPALKSFPATEVVQAFDEAHKVLGYDRALGTQSLIEKVQRVTGTEARARILSVAQAIAAADGNISPEEQAMLDRLRAL